LEIDVDILDLMIEEIKQMHRLMKLEEVYYKEQQVMDENIVEHLKNKIIIFEYERKNQGEKHGILESCRIRQNLTESNGIQ